MCVQRPVVADASACYKIMDSDVIPAFHHSPVLQIARPQAFVFLYRDNFCWMHLGVMNAAEHFLQKRHCTSGARCVKQHLCVCTSDLCRFTEFPTVSMVAVRQSASDVWWARVAIVIPFHQDPHPVVGILMHELQSLHPEIVLDVLRPLFESRNDSEEYVTLAAHGMVKDRLPNALGVIRVSLALDKLANIDAIMEGVGMQKWIHDGGGLVACTLYYNAKEAKYDSECATLSNLPFSLVRREEKKERFTHETGLCKIGLAGSNSTSRAVLIRGVRALEAVGLLVDDVLCTIEVAIRSIPDGTSINVIQLNMRCASDPTCAVAVFMFRLLDCDDQAYIDSTTKCRVYVIPGPEPSPWIVPINPNVLALPGGINNCGMVVTSSARIHSLL